MGRWSQKVWVIESPEADSREPDRWAILPATGPPSAGDAPPPRMAEKTAPASDCTRPSSLGGWGPTVLAYLLGPLTLGLWLQGKHRSLWRALGIGSFVACLVLLLFHSSVTDVLERLPGGGLVWLAVVPGVVLLTGVAWALSVTAVVYRSWRDLGSLPSWMRDPRFVMAAGLLVPGLGMLLAGHPKRAASAFWIVGPLGAGVAVLHRWRWLWEHGQSVTQPQSPAITLEIVLLLAAAAAAVMSLFWLSQALDGMRLAAKTWSRSSSRADVASVALLVSLLLLGIAHPPTAIARDLHLASVSLRLEGLRLIPLILWETATRLDPGEPQYLAQAAELDAALGREAEARAKREIVAQRLEQYARAASRDDQAGRAILDRLYAIHLPARSPEQQAAAQDKTWSRVRTLFD